MLTTEGWTNTMTIEYLINKESNEQFTLKLLNDKDCEVILGYAKELATMETEEWKSKYNSYVVYDYEPFEAYSGGFKFTGVFRASSKIIDYYMYLIQKRIDDINKLEGCLVLQYEGEN